MPDFYVSTYCNFAHSLVDGEPIDHECRVIPPEALEAERDGDFERAIEIMSGTETWQWVVGTCRRSGCRNGRGTEGLCYYHWREKHRA